jgi:hypothetical protein
VCCSSAFTQNKGLPDTVFVIMNVLLLGFKSCGCQFVAPEPAREKCVYSCSEVDPYLYDYVNNFRKKSLPNYKVMVQLEYVDAETFKLTAVGMCENAVMMERGNLRSVSMQFISNGGPPQYT